MGVFFGDGRERGRDIGFRGVVSFGVYDEEFLFF